MTLIRCECSTAHHAIQSSIIQGPFEWGDDCQQAFLPNYNRGAQKGHANVKTLEKFLLTMMYIPQYTASHSGGAGEWSCHF